MAGWFLLVCAAGSGCVALPAANEQWSQLADDDRLVFARARYDSAHATAGWGSGLVVAGGIVFTVGFGMVVSQTGDTHNPKPIIRAGFITLLSGATMLGGGGVLRGHARASRLAWGYELHKLGAQPPP